MCSGTVFEKIRKEFAEIFKRRKPHKQGLGKALPNKIPTGAKGAISEFWHRGRILLSVTANPGAYGGFSFSANITLEKGFAARCRRSFFLSAKDTFQRPSSTRWTGIFSNFLLLL